MRSLYISSSLGKSGSLSKLDGIDVDNPLYATAVSNANRIVDTTVEDNNVASAFTKRSYLVELLYPENRFVVAISNFENDGIKTIEVNSPEAALRIAHERAVVAHDEIKEPLGKLMPSSRVLPDCFEARETLGVSGPPDRKEYSSEWTNAA